MKRVQTASVAISEEQKNLANCIKDVHLSLRRRTRQIGAEKAWQEHLQNEGTLAKYADAMKKLSENYWSVNNGSESDRCRIKWITDTISEYYEKNGIGKEVEKEQKKMKSFSDRGLIDGEHLRRYDCEALNFLPKPPFKLLDVGSCHHPFRPYETLDVYPIDLFPADSDVVKCNFLDLTVNDSNTQGWFRDNMTAIPSDFFDVVVFSLFLEYLPSPKQRHQACVTAYKCLKTNGLLVIITPDSKHASANASVMKSWKNAAAFIGFNRMRFEKLRYLYCMSFRKAISPEYPVLLNGIRLADCSPEDMFIIPQDSVDYREPEVSVKTDEDENSIKLTFGEMPFS